jgi:hypothetical protein
VVSPVGVGLTCQHLVVLEFALSHMGAADPFQNVLPMGLIRLFMTSHLPLTRGSAHPPCCMSEQSSHYPYSECTCLNAGKFSTNDLSLQVL